MGAEQSKYDSTPLDAHYYHHAQQQMQLHQFYAATGDAPDNEYFYADGGEVEGTSGTPMTTLTPSTSASSLARFGTSSRTSSMRSRRGFGLGGDGEERHASDDSAAAAAAYDSSTLLSPHHSFHNSMSLADGRAATSRGGLAAGAGAANAIAAFSLMRLVACRDWDAALRRVKTHPKEVGVAVRFPLYGMDRRLTPLHLACTLDPPRAVVETMLRVGAGVAAASSPVINVIEAESVQPQQQPEVRGSRLRIPGFRRKGRRRAESLPPMPSADLYATAPAVDGVLASVAYPPHPPPMDSSHSSATLPTSNASAQPQPEFQFTGLSAVAAGKDNNEDDDDVGADDNAREGRQVAAHAPERGRSTTPKRRGSATASSVKSAPAGGAASASGGRRRTKGDSGSVKSRASKGSRKSNKSGKSRGSAKSRKRGPVPVLYPDSSSGGWLPIHLACLYRASPPVIEALLIHHPAGAKCKNGMGMLPIHIVCANMSAPAPTVDLAGGGLVSNTGGVDASSSLRDCWDLVEAVRLLLRAFPQSVHVPCSGDRSAPSAVPPSTPSAPTSHNAGQGSRREILDAQGLTRHSSLESYGKTRKGTPAEPRPAIRVYPNMTPAQYADTFIPDAVDHRAVLDLLASSRSRLAPLPVVLSREEMEGAYADGNILPPAGGIEFLPSRPANIQSFTTNQLSAMDGWTTTSKRAVSSVNRSKSLNRRPMSLLRSIRRRAAIEPTKPTKLYTTIASRDWKAVLARIEKNPVEATVWTLMDGADAVTDEAFPTVENDGGVFEYYCHRLPLHRACTLKPPVEVVNALHAAYPDGVQCREKFGMLPLHVACQGGASCDVVEAILGHYPHGARESDEFGLLPLHLACTEGASTRVVAALLRAFPEAAEVEDAKGRRPIDYARESFNPNRRHIETELSRDAGYWAAVKVDSEMSLPDPTPQKPAAVEVRRISSDVDNERTVPDLYVFILRKKWPEAKHRLKTHSFEASAWVIETESDSAGSLPRLPLHLACMRRAPPGIIQALLEANPRAAASRGGTHDLLPIHMACQHGAQQAVVEALLEANPNGAKSTDEFGLLPLHLAITEGATSDVVEALLRAYPEGNKVRDKKGYTPLSYAKHSFHPNKGEVIRRLEMDSAFWTRPPAEDKAELSVNELIDRTEWNFLPNRLRDYPVEATMASVGSIDDSDSLSARISVGRDSVGNSADFGRGLLPIQRACMMKPPGFVVRALLDAAPASVQSRTENGEVPLHLACRHGASLDVVEALLEMQYMGASETDVNGRLPIHAACIAGTNVEILSILLRAAPESATIKDGLGLTPLSYLEVSFHSNKAALIAALHRATERRGVGTSLYDLVARRKWVEASARAREFPAEAAVWNMEEGYGYGRYPIHVACASRPPRRVVAALHNAFPEGVTMKESDGRYPLHLACQTGAALDVIQLLINVFPGAISVRDKFGLLPIHLACSAGASLEVIKMLLLAAPISFEAKLSGNFAWNGQHDYGEMMTTTSSVAQSSCWADDNSLSTVGVRQGLLATRSGSVPARLLAHQLKGQEVELMRDEAAQHEVVKNGVSVQESLTSPRQHAVATTAAVAAVATAAVHSFPGGQFDGRRRVSREMYELYGRSKSAGVVSGSMSTTPRTVTMPPPGASVVQSAATASDVPLSIQLTSQ